MLSLVNEYTGDGERTEFPIEFPYLTTRDIFVSVDGADLGTWRLNAEKTHVVLARPPASGATVIIYRYTSDVPNVEFRSAALLLNEDTRKSKTQTLHIDETAVDIANRTLLFSPRFNAYDAEGHRITRVGLAINNTDAVTKRDLTDALEVIVWTPPSPAEIAAATATALGYLEDARDDRDAVEAIVPLANTVYVDFQSVLATLLAWSLNPPPNGETIVARLDAYFGSDAWRTSVALDDAVVEFTADGTWTKPSGINWVLVEVWGAGAAGAAFNATRVLNCIDTQIPSMPGGGGGAYTRKLFREDELPATVAVTVGTGGVPSTNLGSALDGEGSSFGTYLKAGGGKGPADIQRGGRGGNPWDITFTAPANAIGDVRDSCYGGFFPNNYRLYYGTFDSAFNIVLSPQGLLTAGGAIDHGGGGGAGFNFQNRGAGGKSITGGGGGGSGYTTPRPSGSGVIRLYNGSGYKQVSYPIPSYFAPGPGGQSVQGGKGGDGGGLNQPGNPGAPRGGGGGGAGVPPGSWWLATTGPLGGAGGRGAVRISVW